MKTYSFSVTGMHCATCPLLIESELGDVEEIQRVKVSLAHHSVEISGDFGDKTQEHIAQDLTAVLAPHGYALSLGKQRHRAKWGEFAFAAPIAILFIALFISLQKLGIANLITSSEVTYGTAFIIGLIASVSTCMAVVGGLALSLSATFAKEGDKTGPQLLFHAGRLVSFFILGGTIGAFGSSFQLGQTGTFTLGIAVSATLLILGINLLDITPWTKKLQPTLPRSIGKRIHNARDMRHTLAPFLLGASTFFLPCGFTQSMQIYTLTTGTFWLGATTMFVYALGTLPVLAFLSFSSLGVHTKARSGTFFKTAGLIVIFFALFNFMSALVAAGIIEPLFTL